jgi:hypothetical protein
VKNIKKERIEAGLVDPSINVPLKTVPSKIRLGFVIRNVSNERLVNFESTTVEEST